MTRILIVEDEESYREPLVYQLTREGYDVSAAASGEEGLELFTKGGIDLVLLDLMLPGIDGTALCRRIREQSRVPIIMLTAKSAEIDKVVGLEIGADDYVTKPYSFRELLARIRAVLRRNQGAVEASGAVDDDIPLVCGDISMQVGQHQVTVRGESVFFPLKEFELLEYLMQNKGRVMTRTRYKAPSARLNHPVQAGRTISRKPRIPTTWQGRQLFIFCLPILSSDPSNSP